MDSVARLFPGPGNRRTTRVGVEHELLTRDCLDGRARSPSSGSAPPPSTDLSFEPGGQVELNQPCGAASAVVRRLRHTVAALRTRPRRGPGSSSTPPPSTAARRTRCRSS